jgi:hypothetical protein
MLKKLCHHPSTTAVLFSKKKTCLNLASWSVYALLFRNKLCAAALKVGWLWEKGREKSWKILGVASTFAVLRGDGMMDWDMTMTRQMSMG